MMNRFIRYGVHVAMVLSMVTPTLSIVSVQVTDDDSLLVPAVIGGITSVGFVGILWYRHRQKNSIQQQITEANERLLRAKTENADIEALCPMLRYCGKGLLSDECPFLHTTQGFNQLYNYFSANNLSSLVLLHQANRKHIAADLVQLNTLHAKEASYPEYSRGYWAVKGGLAAFLFCDVTVLAFAGPIAARQLWHAARTKQRN